MANFNNKRQYSKIVFMTLLIAGLLLRFFYLSEFMKSPLFDMPLGADVQEYHEWAREILAGKLLWTKVHIHAPLYPYFLAVLYWISGIDFIFIRGTQLLLGVIAFIPLYFALRNECGKSPVVPLGLFALAMLYPPLVFYQAEIISEALALPLLCISLALLYFAASRRSERLRFYCGAGACAGLAAIAHPLSLTFIVLEVTFLLIAGIRQLRGKPGLGIRCTLPGAVFLAAALIFIIPVCAYNSHLAGYPVLIQRNSGFNFYLGNNPDATGTCYLRPGPKWVKVHRHGLAEADKAGISKDRWFSRQAFKFIAENPGKEIALLCKKFLYVMNFRELNSGADMYPLRLFTPLMQATSWAFGVLAMLGLAGLCYCLMIPKELYRGRHLLILMLGCWGGLTLTVVSSRYRLPILPGLFFLAIIYLRSLCSIRVWRDAAIICPMLLLGAGIVYLPTPPQDSAYERAESDSLLGEAYMKKEQLGLAEEYLKGALTVITDWSRDWNSLGIIAKKQKKFKLAKTYFNKALSLDEKNPLTYTNLAIMASENGQIQQAEKLFAKARSLEFKPEVYYNYAFFEFKRGKIKTAENALRKCLDATPADRRALNLLAAICINQNRPLEAVDLFKRSIALEPDNRKLKVNLAVAYAAAGQKARAVEILKDLLADDPKFYLARRALNHVRKQ